MGTLKIGTVITDGKGNYQQWNGQSFQPAAAPAPGMTKEDRQTLEKLREGARSAGEVQREYAQALPAIKRLGTGPFRGSFLTAAMPDEGGGLMDKIGKFLVGGTARLAGVVNDQTTNDYQLLRALQSRRVLAEQTMQKGVQTEGDAARIKAGDIGPLMSVKANSEVASRGVKEAQRSIDRSNFYAKWANKYGLNALNEAGLGVEEAFDASQQPAATPGKGPTIRRIK